MSCHTPLRYSHLPGLGLRLVGPEAAAASPSAVAAFAMPASEPAFFRAKRDLESEGEGSERSERSDMSDRHGRSDRHARSERCERSDRQDRVTGRAGVRGVRVAGRNEKCEGGRQE